MGFGPVGCHLRHQFEVYRGYAAYKAVIDYSFHGVIQHINHGILDEIPMMVDSGISSFKLYLTYQYKLNDDEVLQAMRHLQRAGALTTVHPENDAAIAQRRAEFINAGKTAPRYHALSRPLECEAEAIARTINLAQLAGNAPLYIVHLSNALGLEYLRLARRRHQPVWVETCPQYLLLDERCYEREDALNYLLSPPCATPATTMRYGAVSMMEILTRSPPTTARSLRSSAGRSPAATLAAARTACRGWKTAAAAVLARRDDRAHHP
jgi:dihydropyrimidinase